MPNYEKEISELVKKAAATDKADDAMKFSQAACNAGNAMRVLIDGLKVQSEK